MQPWGPSATPRPHHQFIGTLVLTYFHLLEKKHFFSNNHLCLQSVTKLPRLFENSILYFSCALHVSDSVC